jgi:hypothetical protein
MNSRAAKTIIRSIYAGKGVKAALSRIKDYPISLTDNVARELARQPDLIEPIQDSLAKLNSLLPSMGLDRVSRLEVIRDPHAYPTPRFQIVIVSEKPLQSENWLTTWGVLSEAINEPMRRTELRRRVFVYLDPGW